MADQTLVQVPRAGGNAAREFEAMPAVSPYAVIGEPDRPPQTQVELQALWHFRRDYPYRPDRYYYAEFETSDPAYVVEDVSQMSPAVSHGDVLIGVANALEHAAADDRHESHIAVEVEIHGISSEVFGSEPGTGTLRPDLALWDHPRPEPGRDRSYYFPVDGSPRLAVEIVSHSHPDYAPHDKEVKARFYARMGIPEYWVVDWKDADRPLRIFSLAIGDRYELQEPVPGPAGSRAVRSRALQGIYMRWGEHAEVRRRLQAFDTASASWLPLADLPAAALARESRAEGRAEERLAGLRAVLVDSLPERQLSALMEAWNRSRAPLPDVSNALTVMREPHTWNRLWPKDVPRPQAQDGSEASRKRDG